MNLSRGSIELLTSVQMPFGVIENMAKEKLGMRQFWSRQEVSSVNFDVNVSQIQPRQMHMAPMSDLQIAISSPNDELSLRVINVSAAVLAQRSSVFLQMITKTADSNAISLSTKRPEALIEIVNAMNEGRELSLQGKSLREVVDLIKEAEKWKMAEVLIGKNLPEWLRNEYSENLIDPDTAYLLKWAYKHNNHTAGILCAQHLLRVEMDQLSGSASEIKQKRATAIALYRDEHLEYFRKIYNKYAKNPSLREQYINSRFTNYP